MDVSGRGASTRSGTQYEQVSDEYTKGNQCEQCQLDELSVPADGYCADCEHYLCGTCIKQHRRLLTLKDHTMLTGEDMPHQRPQSSGAEKCSKHPGKPVELYCQSDDTLGCYLCFAVGHKSCQNVRPISDLSKDLESLQDFRDFQTASQQHETTVELYRKLIDDCHLVNNKCNDKSIRDFQSFRAEIEAKLDRLAVAVKTEAGALKETNKKKLDAVSERVTSYDREMASFMSYIELKRKLKQNDQLLIALKTNMNSIENKVQKLQQLNSEIQVQKYVFHEKSSIKQCLETVFNTGIQKVATVDITCEGEINIKSPDDTGDCYIAGIVAISSTRMVVSDHDNQCLKLIDVDQSNIISKRSLTSRPGDLTTIPKSRLAVTVPALNQIQFFKTDTGLKPCGHIGADGRCDGVVSMGDRLVVGYSHPPMVQIMALSGQVLKSFTTDSSGYQMFDRPVSLSLSPDHTAIIISDWKNNTVTKMSTEGTKDWVYRGKDLQSPTGVATGPGECLYICSRDADSLHVVSSTGVGQTIVHEDHLLGPRAICYNKFQNVLYVSSVSSNHAHPDNFIRRFIVR